MNLLGLIRQIMNELGLQQIAGVIGNQESSVRQMLALTQRFGADLQRDFDWQRLTREHILTTRAVDLPATMVQGSNVITVDTTNLSTRWGVWAEAVEPFTQIVSIDSPTQATINMPAVKSETTAVQFSQVEYPLPDDWKKQIGQTEWDRTNRWPLMGPQTPQSWQSFKSGIVYNGPRERFRIIQNTIAVNPPPPNGLIFAFEYISKNWVIGADGTHKTELTADTDTFVFDTSLMVLGVKTLWLQAKGLDFSLEGAQFSNLLRMCKAQDKSAPVLSLSPRIGGRLLNMENIQDGNWGRPQW